MANQRYIVIQEWMLGLDLKFNEIAAFAIIYGFSQDGKSMYRGSSEYLAYWLRLSRVSVLGILKTLTEKGYIVKEEERKNGAVKLCNYRVSPKYVRVKNLNSCESRNLTRTNKEILPVTSKESLHQKKNEKKEDNTSLWEIVYGTK